MCFGVGVVMKKIAVLICIAIASSGCDSTNNPENEGNDDIDRSQAENSLSIPTKCDERAFHPFCVEQTRIGCKGTDVESINCADYGLTCHFGECRAHEGAACSPLLLQRQCIGNSVISCDSGYYHAESKDCGDDVCASVRGVVGCYQTCSKVSLDDEKFCAHNYGYIYGRCVQSDDHKLVIANIRKDENGETYHDCGDKEYCIDGECRPRKMEVLEKCSQEEFVDQCDGRLYYTCFYDGRFNPEI